MHETTQGLSPRGSETKQRILDVAVDLASGEGLEGLTIGRLAQETAMSKSGLFAHFGSKEELQLATVERARALFEAGVWEQVEKVGHGLPRLRFMLHTWIRYIEETPHRGGCFFAAAAAEFDGRPGAVRDRVARLTLSWIRFLQEESALGRELGHIQRGVDPMQLSFELHAFVQEANLVRQLLDAKLAFTRARRAVDERLRAAATPEGLEQLDSSQSLETKN